MGQVIEPVGDEEMQFFVQQRHYEVIFAQSRQRNDPHDALDDASGDPGEDAPLEVEEGPVRDFSGQPVRHLPLSATFLIKLVFNNQFIQ